MRPDPPYLAITTEVAGALSVSLGYVWTAPACPPPGSGIMIACFDPWAMVPAYAGIGAALALGPALLVAAALARWGDLLARTPTRWVALFIALGAAAVLAADLIIALTFPSVAQRALVLIVCLGLAICAALNGAYAAVRRRVSGPRVAQHR